MAVVGLLNYVGFGTLLVKTGPSAVGVKFAVADKQRGSTACAGIGSWLKMLVELAGTRVLGPFLA